MLLAPLKTLDDWKARLASPDAQWEDGSSAKGIELYFGWAQCAQT
jgi:hypothetical protein